MGNVAIQPSNPKSGRTVKSGAQSGAVTLIQRFGPADKADARGLDAIISIGYRVNSRRAVQFHKWATGILREHLTQGWTLDRQRFETNARELEAAMALVRKIAQSPELTGDGGRGLVDVVTRYTQSFLQLQRYDEGLLTEPRPNRAAYCCRQKGHGPRSQTSKPI